MQTITQMMSDSQLEGVGFTTLENLLENVRGAHNSIEASSGELKQG